MSLFDVHTLIVSSVRSAQRVVFKTNDGKPVNTARVYGPCLRPVLTGDRYSLPVFTGRVDGPCSRVVWTGAREHGPQARVSKMTPVVDTRVHGPCLRPVNTARVYQVQDGVVSCRRIEILVLVFVAVAIASPVVPQLIVDAEPLSSPAPSRAPVSPNALSTCCCSRSSSSRISR